MKKKLCYVLPEYDPETSEHFFHIYELIEQASRLVDIFLVVERAVKSPGFEAVKDAYVLRFNRFPLGWIERLLIFTVIRLKGYHTFYVHQSYSSAIAASVVTRIFAGQTLYWHCGLKKDYMSRWAPNWQAVKAKVFDDWAFLLSLKLINYLVSGSQFMKEYYHLNFGLPLAKTRIMPNWVSLERFNAGKYDRGQVRKEFGLDTSARVVLFLHWLSPRKGSQYLVKIAQEVHKEIPDVVFLVVGEGPYRETLEQEVKESGLGSIIRLVGAVPNQAVPRCYAAADLFIMPSEEEGFPRVLIEAMAMGVPFVANDVGSVREIVTGKQELCVVPKGNASALAEKVVRLLGDSELRRELREIGLVRVRDFSQERVVSIFTSDIISRQNQTG